MHGSPPDVCWFGLQTYKLMYVKVNGVLLREVDHVDLRG
jgi:hypothetical protein